MCCATHVTFSISIYPKEITWSHSNHTISSLLCYPVGEWHIRVTLTLPWYSTPGLPGKTKPPTRQCWKSHGTSSPSHLNISIQLLPTVEQHAIWSYYLDKRGPMIWVTGVEFSGLKKKIQGNWIPHLRQIWTSCFCQVGNTVVSPGKIQHPSHHLSLNSKDVIG